MHVLTPPVDLARLARERFKAVHGTEPLWSAKAPGRVNLIGEHTDYLGGLCLPIALPYATWAVGAPRDDDTVRITSGDDRSWEGRDGTVPGGWAAYVVGALLESGHEGGIDVHVESNVPVGAGLSSSASLICAVARGVSSAPSEELVAPAISAETVHVGAPTGGLDQTVSLLARSDHALLLDFTTAERTHVPWRPADADLALVVVDTGVRHAHTSGGYGDRRAEAEAALAHPDSPDPVLQRRRRHVESENARVRTLVTALHEGDWQAVGDAMTSSHRSLRDDHEVSCEELDVVVEESLAHGALGARMTGGGFGGSAIVLLPTTGIAALVGGVSAAYAARGWDAPVFLHGDAVGPATRWSGGAVRTGPRAT